MCVFLSLELGKQKGELTDITLSPKIFKDKLSLMHLETWIYDILKKSRGEGVMEKIVSV